MSPEDVGHYHQLFLVVQEMMNAQTQLLALTPSAVILAPVELTPLARLKITDLSVFVIQDIMEIQRLLVSRLVANLTASANRLTPVDLENAPQFVTPMIFHAAVMPNVLESPTRLFVPVQLDF